MSRETITNHSAASDINEEILSLQKEAFWNEYRSEIYSWFQQNAESLGELYLGALRLIHGPSFLGRVRFVSHAVRDIGNRLPEIISGVRNAHYLPYVNKLDEISKMWEKEGFSLDGSLPISVTKGEKLPSDSIPIPHKVFKKISALIKDHNDGRQRPVDKAKRLFLGPDRELSEISEAIRPVLDQWLSITDWFMRNAHDSGKTDNDVDIREFRRQFDIFEATLGALLRGFFATIGELDEILEEANF